MTVDMHECLSFLCHTESWPLTTYKSDQAMAGMTYRIRAIKQSSSGMCFCSKTLAQMVGPWWPLNSKDWWYRCAITMILNAEHCCPEHAQTTILQHVDQLCSAIPRKHRIVTQSANQQPGHPAAATSAGALLNCTIWLPLAVTPWNAPSSQAKRCRVQLETAVKA